MVISIDIFEVLLPCTLLVLIFVGTYFRGDRNDRISQVYFFPDSPLKCCKIPKIAQNDRIFQINIVRGYKYLANLTENREN